MTTCNHSHTVTETTGRFYFINGEVDDNIEEHTYCLDCQQEVKSTAAAPVDFSIAPEF